MALERLRTCRRNYGPDRQKQSARGVTSICWARFCLRLSPARRLTSSLNPTSTLAQLDCGRRLMVSCESIAFAKPMSVASYSTSRCRRWKPNRAIDMHQCSISNMRLSIFRRMKKAVDLLPKRLQLCTTATRSRPHAATKIIKRPQRCTKNHTTHGRKTRTRGKDFAIRDSPMQRWPIKTATTTWACRLSLRKAAKNSPHLLRR